MENAHLGTTIVLILLILKSLYCSEFPASEFFKSINVNLDGSSQVEKYLCSGYKDMQCCSCSEDCYEDCCINRYWNESENYDLATYLEIFKEIQREKKRKQNLQCQPILLPLFEGEKSKSLLLKNCNYGSSYRVIYDHRTGMAYHNKDCVRSRAPNLSYPNIKAFCSHNVTNVQAGTVFSSDLRLRYGNCIFDTEEDPIRSCRHEISECDHQSPMYEMCQMYAAPTQNYKNPHCYLCQHNPGEEIHLTGCRDFKDILSENPVAVELTSMNENDLIIKSIQYNFPLLEFINKTKEEMQVDKYRFAQCSFRDSVHSQRSCCECTPDCFKSKLCCVDALWANMSPQTMKHYSQQMVDMSRHGKKHVCRSIRFMLKKPNIQKEKKYYMVTNCSPESEYFELCTKEEDAELQFDWKFVVPVLGADGYLYKNIYCALCNSVYDSQPVNITVDCVNNEIQNNCSLSIHVDFHQTSLIVRPCSLVSPLIDSCEKSHAYYDLCNSYVGPVNGYRNIHCLLCHSNTKSFLKVEGDKCTGRRWLYSWFMLIRFKKNMQVKNVEDQGFLPITNYCINKRFSDIRRITSFPSLSQCRLESIIEDPSIDNCLYQSKLNLFITDPSGTSSIKNIFQDLKLENISFHLYHQGNGSKTFKVNGTFNSVQVKAVLGQYQIMLYSAWRSDTRLILTQNPTPLISDLHALTIQSNFPYGHFCYKILTLDVDEVVFTPNCSAIYENDLIDYHNLSLLISMTKNGIERNVISCARYYMIPNCTLREKRLTTVFKDGSMKDGKGHLYQVEEYIPTRHGAAVCELQEKLLQSDNIEIWLTNALLPFSIIGYCLVIITYISFKTLRNLPGLCTIALTSSLMIGDLMFLLNNLFNLSGLNKVYFLCKLVAILMHFFIIKGYFWTLTISYSIMNHFTKHIVINNNLDVKKKFNHLLMMSSGVSFGIITTAFLLDDSKIVLIGYGDNGTCVPHEFYGRVIFYIIPLFVFIMLSFGFLLRTVVCLVLERSRRNKSLEQSFLKRMSITLMFIKLALVLGINDIIAIVQVINQSSTDSPNNLLDDVIGMIYSVLRSLRGVFLFLVYVCKEEVIGLYKKHFCVKVSKDIKELDIRETSIREEEQRNISGSRPCELRENQLELHELNVRKSSFHETDVLKPIENRTKNCYSSGGDSKSDSHPSPSVD